MTHKIDKKIILSFIIACTVLCLTKSMFFNWKSKLSIWTNVKEDTNIYVEYRRKETSPLNHVKIEKQVNGKFVLKLRGNKTSYVKINVPKNVQIEKVRYSGLKSKDIILDKSKSAQLENYLARPHIDFYNLIVIFAVSFYFSWFLCNAWEHRHDPKEPEKIPSMMNIEFLRIVFTLMVVYHHTCSILKVWNKGWLGVEFFFILSGFFLFITFKPEKNIITYIKQKWIRFCPLIAFGGVICGLFVEELYPQQFFTEFFFITDTGLDCTQINVPAWYLAVLFWVSIFYFYLMKTQKKETVNIIIGVLIFFAYVGCVKKGFSGRYLTLGNDFGALFTMGLLRGIAGTGLGYFLGEIYKITKENIWNFSRRTFTMLEVFFLFYSVALCTYKPFTTRNDLFASLTFACLILLFVIRNGSISNWCNHLIFPKMSKYCLAIFLTHWGVAHHFLTKINNQYPVVEKHVILAISITILASCILGMISHHAIEKPGAKLMKRWLE